MVVVVLVVVLMEVVEGGDNNARGEVSSAGRCSKCMATEAVPVRMSPTVPPAPPAGIVPVAGKATCLASVQRLTPP